MYERYRNMLYLQYLPILYLRYSPILSKIFHRFVVCRVGWSNFNERLIWIHHLSKTNLHSPFLVLVADEKLVELLPLELELVLCVLLDGLLVGNGVVLLEYIGKVSIINQILEDIGM